MNALRQSRDAFFFIYGTNDQVLYNQFSPYLFSELPSMVAIDKFDCTFFVECHGYQLLLI